MNSVFPSVTGSASGKPSPEPTLRPTAMSLVAERRPLTLAFFDLVDSTGLAERVER